MPKIYNPSLVILSVLVAVFVSNTALSLSSRVAHARAPHKSLWLLGGSLAMGSGIWATHFIGMLAVTLPIRLSYDLATTLGSLLIAVLTSRAALGLVGVPRPAMKRLLLSACLLGSGISAMHYAGMAAIQIVPMITYEPRLLALSVAVAVAASFMALYLFRRPRGKPGRKLIARASAALMMGFAIAGMHYTAMAASRFARGAYCPGKSGADGTTLAILVTAMAFAILTITTVLLVYDGYLHSRTRRYNEQLEAANARLQHAANYDPLTGLPNRLMLSRLMAELIGAPQPRPPFAVILIDLDRFKDVNDSLGHLAGDELLRKMSERVQAHLRLGDTLFRLGGDEFVLLAAVRTRAEAEHMAVRVQRAIAEPLALAGLDVHVSASIGIASYPDDGADGSSLLQRADTAMYHVKSNGRNGVQFYSSEMNTKSRQRLEVDDGLRKALAASEFELHYQPKVNIRTGRMAGAEALLRWRHPTRGLIAPAQFIPLAEETGLIVQLGEWALREACKQARSWQLGEVGPVRIAVNVSAQQFRNSNFASIVDQALRVANLDPTLLELELTESALMSDPEASIRLLQSLAARGIAISLDDFGTGYSSLSHLRRLPLTKLKIDRSFVQELGEDESSGQIVRAIISLAHNLHLRVIAEGVETAEQLRFLREAGCDEHQGYLCSPPIPSREFEQLLLRRSLRPLSNRQADKVA